MTERENLLSLLGRKGYENVPAAFELCPHLIEVYRQKNQLNIDYHEFFHMPWRDIDEIYTKKFDSQKYSKYYDSLKPGTNIDIWGVAHEPGSAAAMHMTRMRHPLKDIDSIEEIKEYPFPEFGNIDFQHQKDQVHQIIENDLVAVGNMQMTIWETAWYIRSMEQLMVDMMMGNEIAEFILDEVTDKNMQRAVSFAHSGVDILYIGDDIGMQNNILLSEELYVTWIKPRLKKIIKKVKNIKPDIIIFYHSCGYITPLIPHLIEAGIDVLTPVQPECMDFKEIHGLFGNEISFHGTIGTQSTMPFSSPDQIKKEVIKNLDIAGGKGGLFVAPTHLLEPEVPWDNIKAYVEACQEYLK